MLIKSEFEISQLIKSYSKKTVLNIAKAQFSSGNFFAIMGRNGSGKSTLMRLLAQQEVFDSGEILFNGHSLKSPSTRINPFVAFIAEDHELPFVETLTVWMKLFQKATPQFDRSIFDYLQSSLSVDFSKRFHELSRGQKMKALFCLLAAQRPSVYLLDEITSVLDLGSRWRMMEFLGEESKRGCLVAMSTNIASEMQGYATDVVIIEKGQILFESSTDSLSQHFKKVRVSKIKEPKNLPSNSIRKISFNPDGTEIYLLPKNQTWAPDGCVEDKREISVVDIQSYFTAGDQEP